MCARSKSELQSLPANKTLRIINLISFPLALPLLIAYPVASKYDWETTVFVPLMGIIPMFFSAFFALLRLGIRGRQSDRKMKTHERAVRVWASMITDFLIAGGLLAMLILSWIWVPRGYHGSSIMLGTYCTVFFMINFGIHAYTCIEAFCTIFMIGFSVCPLCRHELPERQQTQETVGERSNFFTRGGYYSPVDSIDIENQLVAAEEDTEASTSTARPSMQSVDSARPSMEAGEDTKLIA